MDVRIRFSKEPKEYNDRTCVIVIDINDLLIGLIVDSVSEVLTIQSENIVKPPKLNNAYNYSCIKSIGKVDKDIKLIIDCKRLLTKDELEDLNTTF